MSTVPETIYEREAAAIESPEKKNTLSRRLLFRTPTNAVGETLAQTFRRPYAMFVYPAVLLPSFWVSVCVMSEIANTAGFALNFGVTTHFQFDPRQVGFCYFSGLIGACLGEVTAGPLCDFVAKRALRKGETWRPEKLLPLTITGGITIVVRNATDIVRFPPADLSSFRLGCSCMASNCNTVTTGHHHSSAWACSSSARKSSSPSS